MGEFLSEAQRKHGIIREIMDAAMAGSAGSIARHFAPGAVFSNRSNAGIIDAPWFNRMEGEYRLQGEDEAKSFLNELLRRATYISYKPRGIVVEDDEGASRCDWTPLTDRPGLFPEDLDEKDPWQFRNILVR